MRVHCLMHVAHEGPGLIEDWAASRGHALAEVHLHRGDQLPTPAELEWLIVMGGPMNVYEEERYPWLAPETQCIRDALQSGKRVLGICLGAQLVAKALGAQVRSNGQQEIGWYPITLAPDALRLPLFRGFPGSVPAYHWHGDTFDIPESAWALGSSAACANQGFVLKEGHGVGLQFHWEVRPTDVETWLAGGEIGAAGPYVQSPEAMRCAEAFEHAGKLMETLLDRMATGV